MAAAPPTKGEPSGAADAKTPLRSAAGEDDRSLLEAAAREVEEEMEALKTEYARAAAPLLRSGGATAAAPAKQLHQKLHQKLNRLQARPSKTTPPRASTARSRAPRP